MSKTRDDLAREYAIQDLPSSRVARIKIKTFRDGFDAAKKQYLGKIQELKSKIANYKLCVESQRKQDEAFYKKYAELKAELESLKRQVVELNAHLEEFKGLREVSRKNRKLSSRLKKQLAIAVSTIKAVSEVRFASWSASKRCYHVQSIALEALKQIEELEK